MRRKLRRTNKMSDGERVRALAFLLVAFSSGGLGFLTVLHLDGNALFEGLTWYHTWIITAASLGGMAALFLSGDRMGQRGVRGALRAVTGGIWVTFVGSLIGGTLGLPLYGTMFGPFIVTVTLLGAPVLALLWMFNLLGIHFLLQVYQTERDSIFTPSRLTAPDHPNSLSVRLKGRFV